MTNDLVPYKKKFKPPVAVLREGAVVVKIWQNKSGGTTYLSATVERIFEDRETGETRTAKSFGLRDINILTKLLTRARAEMEKRTLNNLK